MEGVPAVAKRLRPKPLYFTPTRPPRSAKMDSFPVRRAPSRGLLAREGDVAYLGSVEETEREKLRRARGSGIR
jgi:hypothetical protein